MPGKFEGIYLVKLARTRGWEDKDVEIVKAAGTGPYTLTIKLSPYPDQVWEFPGPAGNCTLLAGVKKTSCTVPEKIDLYGSCTVNTLGSGCFKYLIALNPDGPPDNQVVEWVAEDQG